MSEFLNLMGITVVIKDTDGVLVRLAPSGRVAHVQESDDPPKTIIVGGRSIYVRRISTKAPKIVVIDALGEESTFPSRADGVVILVGMVVLEALRGSGRVDVFSPDTGYTARRTDKGRIEYVEALIPVGPDYKL